MALFGKKSDKKNSAAVYLLMDSNSRMLARGTLKTIPGAENLNITLIEGDADRIARAGVVQAVPQDKTLPVQMTRVLDCWDDSVILEPMRELGAEVRRNFRIPVVFDTFLYPAGGGRAAARSVDLSCGGIAFNTAAPFAAGDHVQVVVPLTSEGPLLLTAEILRARLDAANGNFYACKFVDMIDDEETLLREAVFAIQLSTAKSKRNESEASR